MPRAGEVNADLTLIGTNHYAEPPPAGGGFNPRPFLRERRRIDIHLGNVGLERRSLLRQLKHLMALPRKRGPQQAKPQRA